MKCLTTDKKIREIGGALENKMTFFPLYPCIYTHPPQIRALPPYKVYVFGMSKTWATYC